MFIYIGPLSKEYGIDAIRKPIEAEREQINNYSKSQHRDEGVAKAVQSVGAAFQAAHAGNQDVLKCTVFKLCQPAEPELCRLIFGRPHVGS